MKIKPSKAAAIKALKEAEKGFRKAYGSRTAYVFKPSIYLAREEVILKAVETVLHLTKRYARGR